MKDIILIANRMNALRALPEFPELRLKRLYVLEGSLLDSNLEGVSLSPETRVIRFAVTDKASLIKEIEDLEFDILLSNGCPIILPVSKMKKPQQLYINVHPTLLPDLKGKTPLNGVFMTHRTYIGATMHYINDGIDEGFIIAQSKVKMTDDLDQGLVYKVSFDNETVAFRKGMRQLIDADYNFPGTPQPAGGSYFNRTDELQTIVIDSDSTDLVIDKVKSFGIKGQGSHLKAGGSEYTVYAAEKIVNGYLLNEYADLNPGEIAFFYDDKFLIKTLDGILKVTDYEVQEKDKG